MLETKELITIVSGRQPRKAFWSVALGVSGIIGVGGGIAGLLLSFLAAEGVVEPSSNIRLAVPILVVLSLTSFMAFAHSMDRLQEIKDRQ